MRLAALALLWLSCFAGTFPFVFDYPDTNADGSPLTDLHHAEVWLFRCPYDSLRLADIPAIGAQGQTQNGSVEALGGHAYWLKVRLADFSGNRSLPAELMFALEPDTVALPPPPDTSGTGIIARYYNGKNRNTLVATRRDTTINFQWGLGSPMPGVNVDQFSADWRGKLVVPMAGAWTLFLEVDDGGRLSEGVPNASNVRIDKLIVGPLTEWSWTGNLAAGEHGLEVVFMADTGNAQIALKWSGPGVAKQVVPRSALK